MNVMEKDKLVQQLSQKVDDAWNTYRDGLLKLTPSELIDRSQEIAVTRFFYNEIKSGGYPDHLLSHLLQFENPLAVLYDQWTSNFELEGYNKTFEYELLALWDHGIDPDEAPDQIGMEMR